MEAVRVRIHEVSDWEHHRSTVIGLTGVADGYASTQGLMLWLADRGRLARHFPEDMSVKHGISDRYIQVEHPPLDEEDIQALATACVGEMFTASADTPSSVHVYDNRDVPPGLDGPPNMLAATPRQLGRQVLAA